MFLYSFINILGDKAHVAYSVNRPPPKDIRESQKYNCFLN